VALAHLILRGHNARPRWDKTAAQTLMRFGKWIFLSTLLTYTVGEADRLIFGKLTSLGDLGVYHVALTIASVPTGAMHQLAGKVIFPLFSRVNQTGENLSDVFRRARQLHLVLSGWALSGLIGGGQAAIRLVYEDRYEAGGWMLQLLAIGYWFATPDQTNMYANLAQGRPRWLAAANFGKLVGMVLLIPLGYALGGFPGALTGFAMSELFRYAVSTTGVMRHGLSTIRQDLGVSVVVALAAVAGRYTVHFLSDRGVHVVLQCLAVFVVVTSIWLPWLWPYLKEAAARVRARLGRAG
jgi:O-antigen/teichoic acid export membrane protein